MKNRNAFTLIELLVCLAIVCILAAMLLPAVTTAKKRAQEKQRQEQKSPDTKISVGDTVYVDGLNITGKVNRIRADLGTDFIDILVVWSNGFPTVVEQINENLIKKVTPLEDWRRR